MRLELILRIFVITGSMGRESTKSLFTDRNALAGYHNARFICYTCLNRDQLYQLPFLRQVEPLLSSSFNVISNVAHPPPFPRHVRGSLTPPPCLFLLLGDPSIGSGRAKPSARWKPSCSVKKTETRSSSL